MKLTDDAQKYFKPKSLCYHFQLILAEDFVPELIGTKFNFMTKKFLSLLSAAIVFYGVNAQDFSSFIQKRAVSIDKLDNLKDSIYKMVSGYRLIMLGEMHGTNEPASFLVGLTELLARKGDSILVGFEIPSEEMTKFLTEHSDSSVNQSDFFSKTSVDGRANVAWAAAIRRLNKNRRVKIFFYDVNKDEHTTMLQRDSIMYLKVKKRLMAKPRWKTLTIGGNVHNMILPYKGKNKMALYLSLDTTLNLTNKICSLNHYYQNGTMLNNQGHGLELHKVEDVVTDYSSSVDYNNYLLLYPATAIDNYTGVLFTRHVTAAKLVSDK